MRSLLFALLASLVVLTTLLIACGDDEQAMPDDRQVEQPQEQGDAQPASAPSTSAAQAFQSEQQTDPEAEEEPPDAAQSAPASVPSDTILVEAEAAYRSWWDNVETMFFNTIMESRFFGVAVPMSAEVAYQTEPFMMSMSLDMRGLLDELGEDLSEDDAVTSAEFLQMQMLLTEDSSYMSMPGLGGWVDVSDDLDMLLGEFAGVLFVDPATLGDSAGLQLGFHCAEMVNDVSITYDVYDGEDVWLIDCMVDVDAMNEAMAEMLDPLGFNSHLIYEFDESLESIQLRAAISRSSGAPLLVESRMMLVDVFGLSDDGTVDDGADEDSNWYFSFVQTLHSWNEPVVFPTPTPLLDVSLFDTLMMVEDGARPAEQDGNGFRNSPELLTSDELIAAAREWVSSADELSMQFVTQAVINGKPRIASTIARASQSQGVFETKVVVDGGSAFRLFWNHDGIWTGTEQADGQTAWEQSTPAALGFTSVDIDEYLAAPDRVNLEPYAALLDLAWVSRTIEGNRPPVYELGIETGPRLPGDDYFEQVVDLLKAETAELLAENITVEAIDQFATTITIYGHTGEVVSQIMTTEFESSAGRVELVASLEVSVGGPLEFSSPGE